ncbi:hypothetical protein HYU09_02800 [Candidatus Woesearchaeota archaeon]|nr:hypothetical protein [Candidatus Woesearchaeota archaeon]
MNNFERLLGLAAIGGFMKLVTDDNNIGVKPKTHGPGLEHIANHVGGDNEPPVDDGNVVTTSNGYQLGDIVNMSFMINGRNSTLRETFTEAESALISFYDSKVKEVQKGQSRHMGGVYEEHIKDMLQIYFDITSQLKIKPDYKFVASIIIHDYFEDHPEMRGLLKEFDRMMRRYREDDKLQKNGNIERMLSKIRQKRFELISGLSKQQEVFLEEYGRKHDLGDEERRQLMLDAQTIVGIAEWLTRNVEQRFFHDSVYLLHRMNTVEDYADQAKGSPLQSRLMHSFGIQCGTEPTEYYLMRALGKAIDRIALSREREQRYTEAEAIELGSLVEQNERLRDIYGHVDFRGSEMPRPYLLNLLHRNMVVLSNMGYALNEYGRQIVRESSNDSIAFAYLRAIQLARKRLIEESRKIVGELTTSYEQELPNETVDEVKTLVNAKPKGYYRRLTGEGPVSRGLGLDTDHPADWADLDKDHKGNNSVLRMSRNYEDALVFGRLLTHFEEPKKNKIDLNNGNFQLFYIEGLTGHPALAATPYTT